MFVFGEFCGFGFDVDFQLFYFGVELNNGYAMVFFFGEYFFLQFTDLIVFDFELSLILIDSGLSGEELLGECVGAFFFPFEL